MVFEGSNKFMPNTFCATLECQPSSSNNTFPILIQWQQEGDILRRKGREKKGEKVETASDL